MNASNTSSRFASIAPNLARFSATSFLSETRAAYLELAHAGDGSMKSLEGDDQINQQVLMLAFGNNWAEQVSSHE